MSDRELLEMAAKAAGIKALRDPHGMLRDCTGLLPENNIFSALCWNPLTDDGDAFRLAVKLEIAVNPYAGKTVVAHDDSRWFGHEKWDCNDDDPLAATRRAIVRAAAEIGKGRK